MIKKIILLVLILTFAVVPVVHGDGAVSPTLNDGDFIDIKIEFDSVEANIGEEFTFTVTVTNKTKASLTMEEFLSSTMGIYDYPMVTLGAYETITLEISGIIEYSFAKYYFEWYTIDNEFYVDFLFDIDFWIDGKHYYDYCDEKTPIKITNLHDGSDLVEIEWLDDRDTLYYYWLYEYDYERDDIYEQYAEGVVHYKMRFNNLSDVNLYAAYDNEVWAGGEKIIYSDFWRPDELSYNEDYITCHIDNIFVMDDKYYCYKFERVYKTQIIDKPNVNLEIDFIEDDKFVLSITNLTEDDIKDFYFSFMDGPSGDCNYIREIINLSAHETFSNEYILENDMIYGMSTGYLLDGMMFGWSMYIGYTVCQDISFTPVTYLDHGFYNFDYDWYIERTEAEAAAQQSALTLIPTPDISETSTPIPTAEVVVVKRQNPMLWALAVVLLLAIGASVMIIVAIVKKGKVGSND